MAFVRFGKLTGSTKRNPTVSAGKRGLPVTNIASLTCTYLDPVDAEIRQRLQLETPHELLQTFVDGSLDIREGDVLVVGSAEYPIKSVASWADFAGKTFLHLIVEELK